MKYKIFFITNEFKELIDESIIGEMVEMEEDDFSKKQLNYFFLKPSGDEIYHYLIDNLKNREDVIIDEKIILFKNQITDESATLMIDENSFILTCMQKLNPIVCAIKRNYCIVLYPIE